MTIRTNVYETWTVFLDTYRTPPAARARLRELGASKGTLMRLSTITGDLDKIRQATVARDHAKRNAYIVSALQLGATRDDVSKAAGVAIESLRAIWREAGHAGKPYNDTPASWDLCWGHSSPWQIAEVVPPPPRPARWLDVWMALKSRGQKGAVRALLDLGVPDSILQFIKDVDNALQEVYNLGGDICLRDNAIVRAVALGIPLDIVGQSAGITRERVRQIWKKSGRTDKPWRAG